MPQLPCEPKSSSNTIPKSYKTNFGDTLASIFESQSNFVDFNTIQKKLNALDKAPNKSTIYRQLEKMQNSNLISTTQINGKQLWSKYEHTKHNHFVCGDCYKIVCIHLDPSLIKQIKLSTASLFSYTNMRLEGQCLECVKI